MKATSGKPYWALVSGARPGAVGEIGLGLELPDDTSVEAFSTDGIVESAPGSYTATRVAPVVAEATTYVLVWYDPVWDESVTEPLIVNPTGFAAGPAKWFTVEDARAVSPLGNATKYPSEMIEAAREVAQSSIEDACGVSFTPSPFTVRVVSHGAPSIWVTSRLLTVESATRGDGEEIDLTGLEPGDYGTAHLPRGWPTGLLTFTGMHGYPVPPERVKRAAILLTKRMLVDSPINDRTTSLTTVDGNTERFVTAGVTRLNHGREALFDVPEVNACVAVYGVRDGLAIA
ncbi:MAG: hypothetical protein Q8O56_12865 [Solirubrobacteraceae bacterium]|nr:hypothetical protein [Solirubrobacteraceae bacterium]